MYNPFESMLPQSADQVDGTLFDVNCSVAPSPRDGLPGEIVKAGAVPTVSTVVAVYAFPLEAVAVIWHMVPVLIGAVNKPLPSMVPHEVVQFTGGVFTVNCCVCAGGVVGLAGVIVRGDVTVAVVDAV